MDANNWIKIALDDLKSAQLLYDNGHYRNSYFCFQQASKKANKAFTLLDGLLNPNEIKIILHNQLKIYRKVMSKKNKNIKKINKSLKIQPEKATSKELKTIVDLVRSAKSIIEKSRTLDRTNNKNLLKITPTDLNYFIRSIKQIKNTDLKFPRYYLNKYKEIMSSIGDWIGQYETPKAIEGKLELLKITNNPELTNEFYRLFIPELIPKLRELAFIQMTLFFSVYITHQHSVCTRYPDDKNNPAEMYTIKNPLIKKQPLFMELVEEALIKLNKIT